MATGLPASYRVEDRWNAELTADGFTPVSIFFLDNYHRLTPPITHGEAMFLIHLIRYKWTSADPFPGFQSIATQMGISIGMARAHARSLEQKHYLLRVMRVGQTNRFKLDPLFEALKRLRLILKPPEEAQAAVPLPVPPPMPAAGLLAGLQGVPQAIPAWFPAAPILPPPLPPHPPQGPLPIPAAPVKRYGRRAGRRTLSQP